MHAKPLPPAFQFYAKDWLAFPVQRMSLAAQGAYLKCLCFTWASSADQCSLVDDDDFIARAIGIPVEHWRELRAEIQHDFAPMFQAKEGRLVSPWLKQEAAKQRKYRKLQAQKGQKSAQQRFNRGSTAVQPEYQPEGNSSSSSSKKEKEREARMRVETKFSPFPTDLEQKGTPAQRGGSNGKLKATWKPDVLERLYNAWPEHRKDWEPAVTVWNELKATEEEVEAMKRCFKYSMDSHDWIKDRGKFIPSLAKWLKERRWERPLPQPWRPSQVEMGG